MMTAQAAESVRYGKSIVSTGTIDVARSPEIAFRPIERIGGRTGYYSFNWLWQSRGMLDRMLGGPGMRGRGASLRVGDKLDYWRVDALEPARRLRLVCEMKLPGRGWLEFEVQGDASGSTITQTAVFDPAGLGGLLYWYGMYPLHDVVFRGMLSAIAAAAMREP
jgi:hypothetical protein